MNEPVGHSSLERSPKDTLFLPRTPVPMKAPNLPAPTDYDPGDPHAPSFVLHDGPPYANGRLHMGHALNKLMKDMVLRDRRRRGFHAPFLPNWDCHGLPLESRFSGKRDRFETQRAYLDVLGREARKWADAQHEGFQTLGVAYDAGHRTLSCDPATQALVMHQFHRMVKAGLVYRRERPVSWSPVDGTVLADAESLDVEVEVTTVVAAFPLTGAFPEGPVSLAVWTTTPWSLPGNAGVAWNPDMTYGLFEHSGRLVVAGVCTAAEMLPGSTHLRDVGYDELATAVPKHPLARHGYPLTGSDRQLVAASFVAANKGTGFVHMGPAHSVEDWTAWQDDYPNVVGADGRYVAGTPLFEGLAVVDGGRLGEADGAVMAALEAEDAVLNRDRRVMTLKQSWRSDGLLVTRATDQWFVDLTAARRRALEAVENGEVQMVPETSRNRFLSMLRTRPDWLVSRQREWGVPLGLYVHRNTGEPLVDDAVLDAVEASVRNGGVAAWLETPASEHFAAAGRSDHDDWEKTTDVLDVWFDSACVADYGQGPADLVVEGTDQHRGWFSSTLLKACALGDPLPFRRVLTHGFVLDDQREKRTKARGNGLTPEAAVARYGADVLRLWAALVDVTSDMPFGQALLDEARTTRDKVRNVLRYMTGVLRDWTADDAEALPSGPHDLLLLAEMQTLVNACDQAGDELDFRAQLDAVRDFVDHRLSGHHLDVRKDRLYCDGNTSAWHETRATLMAVYVALLDLLDTLMPGVVEEMKAVCPPRPTRMSVAEACPSALELMEHLLKAEDVAAALQKAAGLKRQDAALTLSAAHVRLLGAGSPDDLARWLKVDRVFAGEDNALETVEDPLCPRCRLHRELEPNGWCGRCESVSAG